MSTRRLTVILVLVVVGMIGLTFAAVPLYRLFCQVTGFAGTPRKVMAESNVKLDRRVTVKFNADTYQDMPWIFYPVQKEVNVAVGENTLIYYRAINPTQHKITGQASFNVTPEKVGPYFNKIQCFCFQSQTLESGQSVDMAVTFFVDPKIEEDPNLKDLNTITLSYTFFRADE
ncbi:MAG: cytochrome c oxidase assembly protein [Alphaproteobacteria bacterium]|nr:cytochrome c oxidase assembly protein [Alphaproteobacteria bacterium]